MGEYSSVSHACAFWDFSLGIQFYLVLHVSFSSMQGVPKNPNSWNNVLLEFECLSALLHVYAERKDA
jgi:hypothetical protein